MTRSRYREGFFSEDQETKLFTDFPRLFQGRFLSSQHNLMCFGFECCPDVWFDLVYELCQNIEVAYQKINDAKPDEYIAFQVKEKGGELRFYMTKQTQEIHDLIEEASQKSRQLYEDWRR